MKNPSLFAFALLSSVSICAPAVAGSSSWFETDGARMRLISLPAPDGKTLRAGLQFEMQEGWKTYWRSPGGSGLPPQIQFLGSKNVAKAQMRLPVPSLYRDEAGTSIGYKGNVVFPIEVKLAASGRPATLAASGVVGICSDICIPVPFQLSVEESAAGGSSFDIIRALNKAQSDLPKAAIEGFSIKSASSDEAAQAVTVSATVPKGSGEANLFVEGPSSWYLSAGKLTSQKENSATFTIDVQDAPSDSTIVGTELVLTLVANGKGIEQKIKITK